METANNYDGASKRVHPCVFTRTRFTGKERDTESGNDYFGARYYNSGLGRFESPDPLRGTLSIPQSLNKYSYAMNRPISAIDSGGFLTIILGGAFNGKSPNFGNAFNAAVSAHFQDPNVRTIGWSGNPFRMSNSLQSVNGQIDALRKQYPHEPLRLVGFSDGGNVAKLYTQMAGAQHVDTLLTLGTPNRPDIQANMDNVSAYVNVYSLYDGVQGEIGGPLWCILCVASTTDQAENVEVSLHPNGKRVGHHDMHSADVIHCLENGGCPAGQTSGSDEYVGQTEFINANIPQNLDGRVAPVSMTIPNQSEGAPGPSPLGTGDIDTMQAMASIRFSDTLRLWRTRGAGNPFD